MATAEATAIENHSHHWLIDEVHGPVSKGVCKQCGAEREFRNWLEETPVNDQRRPAA